MSYSFTVTAATKEDAVVKAENEFDAIVAQQPNHAKDHDAVLANIDAALAMLRDDDTMDVRVACYGSLMWNDDPDQIIGVTLHVDAYCVPQGDGDE